MDQLRESSKRTDDAMSSGTTSQQLASSSLPRRSARVSKFKNYYGYVTGKVPASVLFPNLHSSIPTTAARDSNIPKPFHVLTKREIRQQAKVQAHYVAVARARESLPRFKHYDKDALTQKCRQSLANSYRECYRYGPMKDEKTCFWSGGGRYSWSELSSGITWVAVHGVDHTCAVSRRIPGLDPARLSDLRKEMPELDQWRSFLHSVIAEIEDTSTTSAFYQKIDQSAKTSPFAVVSVAPHVEESSSKASSASLSEKQCHDFLDKTLKDGKVFSTDETVQIAISALQHLFCQKFKSEEIVAYHLGRSGVKSMLLLSNEEVEKHLA